MSPVYISTAIPDDVADKLRDNAARHQRSMAAEVRVAVKTWSDELPEANDEPEDLAA